MTPKENGVILNELSYLSLGGYWWKRGSLVVESANKLGKAWTSGLTHHMTILTGIIKNTFSFELKENLHVLNGRMTLARKQDGRKVLSPWDSTFSFINSFYNKKCNVVLGILALRSKQRLISTALRLNYPNDFKIIIITDNYSNEQFLNLGL